MALKIICIVFWVCVARVLVGLVMICRGHIFSLIPVAGALVTGTLLLAAIAILASQGQLSWYEKGAKALADSVFPTLADRVRAVVTWLRAVVSGLFSSVSGAVRSVF